MIPYAGFTYFGVLLYALVPTLLLGVCGRARWRWALLVTALMLLVQYAGMLDVHPGLAVRELWIVLGFLVFQCAVARLFLRSRSRGAGRGPFYAAIAAGILPLAAAKFIPLFSPSTEFGFLGISYVTFRALDVLFSIHDRVITELSLVEYSGFLLFFPTISSGPIDRFRRFMGDWRRPRTRADFLADLDGAVHRLFRGFLYKFIVAALIARYWMDPAAEKRGFGHEISYMYAYTFYLFFDFAGYSAFAISLSWLFGIRTPENFDRPFLASSIRDFWNRWHITLSFWFRDHVYMRFLLAAARGKWFANKHAAAITGYFVSFGLMGLWHGPQVHYLVYGAYHACLLAGYDIFARWNKEHQVWGESPLWRAAAVFITFQFISFGMLIFSGHLIRF